MTCHFSLRLQNSEYPWIFQVSGANQNARKLLSTDLVNTKYNLHRSTPRTFTRVPALGYHERTQHEECTWHKTFFTPTRFVSSQKNYLHMYKIVYVNYEQFRKDVSQKHDKMLKEA